MEKIRTYYAIRFTVPPHEQYYYGDGPNYVVNLTPHSYRATWSTISELHRATHFSNLARAKQVARAKGLSDERERLKMDIVQVNEYRTMATIFPEPNVVEQLAQVEAQP